MIGESKRTIKLCCPSQLKAVSFVAWDDQRLDLGSIARTFGLDPATLKLNGHFISSGVDHVASSVTWKSLLSFFSARGLSTGTTDSDAIIVDGKLCKVGNKRAHEPTDIENGIPSALSTSEYCNDNGNGKPPLEDTSYFKRKMFRESNSGFDDGADQTSTCDGLNQKRKESWENVGPLKRIRTNETNSDFHGRENGLSRTFSNRRFQCSSMGENMKRTREDEVAVTAPCKKIR